MKWSFQYFSVIRNGHFDCNSALFFQAGTESIAPWKDVLKLAMVTDNAKPIMLSNGNVGANPDGSERAATFR